MMRTTLTIDDTQLKNVIHYTQQSNPAQAMRSAIDAFVEQAQINELLALRGQVQIDDNWRAMRQLETLPLDRPFLDTPAQ